MLFENKELKNLKARVERIEDNYDPSIWTEK